MSNIQIDAFGNPIVTNTVANATGVVAVQGQQVKPKAKYWLNIGLVVKNPQSGEDQFLQVAGCGIGLDTVNRPEIKGSLEFQQLLTAQTSLLDKLIETASTLGVGESRVLPHQEGSFALQLTHADVRTQDERLEQGKKDNPYLKAMQELNL